MFFFKKKLILFLFSPLDIGLFDNWALLVYSISFRWSYAGITIKSQI
jgi:hypothetical protein